MFTYCSKLTYRYMGQHWHASCFPAMMWGKLWKNVCHCDITFDKLREVYAANDFNNVIRWKQRCHLITTAVRIRENRLKVKQVLQHACKTQIPPYGLIRTRRRPQFRASLHAAADATPRPPTNALVRRRRSSNGAYHSYRAGWGFAALSAFFVPGDLDLWPLTSKMGEDRPG